MRCDTDDYLRLLVRALPDPAVTAHQLSFTVTLVQQAMSEQAIQESEQNSEAGSIGEANTQLATAASSPSFMGAGLEIGIAGGSAYASANMMESIYDGKPGGGPPVTSAAPPPLTASRTLRMVDGATEL